MKDEESTSCSPGMAAHFYPAVILCILSWSNAPVNSGFIQLEHPQQAFCEADFGKVVAKFMK